MAIDLALIEPEIPQNTGNIARTCVALGSSLHLVGPLGFSLDDRYLKRAGLDYWFDLDLHLWDRTEDLLRHFTGRKIYYATTKGGRVYSEADFVGDTLVLFGKESKGLPESLLAAHPERCIRIPMRAAYRSLNLSNAAAVIAYEAARQNGFADLQAEGRLTGRGD